MRFATSFVKLTYATLKVDDIALVIFYLFPFYLILDAIHLDFKIKILVHSTLKGHFSLKIYASINVLFKDII